MSDCCTRPVRAIGPETIGTQIFQVVLDNHDRFLGYLQRNAATRDAAEKILHETYLASLEQRSSLRPGDSVTAWFQERLRRAVLREAGSEPGAIEKLGRRLAAFCGACIDGCFCEPAAARC